MMGAAYAVIEEKYPQKSGHRISYGITIYSGTEQKSERVLIDSIHDITSDKEKLEKLVNNCNRLGLSTVHICDVVEDFLIG